MVALIEMEIEMDVKRVLDALEVLHFGIFYQMGKEMDTVRDLFDKTVATWKKKPVFTWEMHSGNDLQGIVGTDNDIYRFLNDGTKERWAIMSADFQRKTVVRSLTSQPGRGGAILRGKAVGKPRPGIEAGKWDDEIVKVRKAPFYTNMQAAVNRGLKKAGVT